MRYHTVVAQRTCCVFPNALITGSFSRKFVKIVPENIHRRVEIQQASGCLREKYKDPKKACQLVIDSYGESGFEFLGLTRSKVRASIQCANYNVADREIRKYWHLVKVLS